MTSPIQTPASPLKKPVEPGHGLEPPDPMAIISGAPVYIHRIPLRALGLHAASLIPISNLFPVRIE
jgi:hypothetical protein